MNINVIAEQETVGILLRRSQNCYDDFCSNNNEHGQIMLTKYIDSINDAIHEINSSPLNSNLSKTKMFPTIKQAPEFTMLWTLRAKALCVVKLLCHNIVSFSARKRFRYSYPPLYECYRCYQTFLFRKELYNHCKWECSIIHTTEFISEIGIENDNINKNSSIDHNHNDHNHHGINIGVGKYYSHLISGRNQTQGRSKKRMLESRVYSKTMTDANKYTYNQKSVDYFSAKLAQHVVDAILHPIAIYIDTNKAHGHSHM